MSDDGPGPGLKGLNLGCGTSPKKGWLNLDIQASEGVDVVFDLERCPDEPLPFDADTFDALCMWHVLEHVENVLPLMQELHRIAKPSGQLLIATPHGGNDEAWMDPTHKRPYFAGSYDYFAQPFYSFADYGYRGDWSFLELRYRVAKVKVEDGNGRVDVDDVLRRIDVERNLVEEMIVLLSAVKPIRARDRNLLSKPKVKVFID